jgi:hypothetical protein
LGPCCVIDENEGLLVAGFDGPRSPIYLLSQNRLWRRGLIAIDIELMPQYQDFRFQPPPRLEAVAQHADEKEGNCNHATIML